MRYVIQFTCFVLFVLMSCSEEGDSASTGNAESMATFSRLEDGYRKFAEIYKSLNFSTPSPGFTFEKTICGSAYVESAAFDSPSRLELITQECFEFNFDGEIYTVLSNFAPFDGELILLMQLVFYGHPETGNYNLNCMTFDCDPVYLTLSIIDSDGDTLVRYYGMPNVLNVTASSDQVIASFDGLFYSEDFDEGGPTFNVAGTLACCGMN